MTTRLLSVFVAALFAGASARSAGAPSSVTTQARPVAPARATVTEAALVVPAPALFPEAAVEPGPALPAGVQVGVPVLLPVPEDRAVLVMNAPADNRRAIVYLHGMCGDVHAVESWKETAVRYGTLVGLLGDRPCGAGGRFKWPVQIERIEPRIERALEVVRAARGGLLDTSELILFGYSQGADRASLLARQFPERYRRVVLGGPTYAPSLENLGSAEAVAVFGGELESTAHMRSGAEGLSAAGKLARFFVLPAASHGHYGPEGARVMDQLFSWLLSASPRPRAN